MTLKEYKAGLDQLLSVHPDLIDKEVVYSKDDEGNWFQPVYFNPSIGNYKDGVFITPDLFEEEQITEGVNAVCIN